MADVQAISELLRRAADAGGVPGVAVAAVAADGTAVTGAPGMRDTDGDADDGGTRGVVAAMTKAVGGAELHARCN